MILCDAKQNMAHEKTTILCRIGYAEPLYLVRRIGTTHMNQVSQSSHSGQFW